MSDNVVKLNLGARKYVAESIKTIKEESVKIDLLCEEALALIGAKKLGEAAGLPEPEEMQEHKGRLLASIGCCYLQLYNARLNLYVTVGSDEAERILYEIANSCDCDSGPEGA